MKKAIIPDNKIIEEPKGGFPKEYLDLPMLVLNPDNRVDVLKDGEVLFSSKNRDSVDEFLNTI